MIRGQQQEHSALTSPQGLDRSHLRGMEHQAL